MTDSLSIVADKQITEAQAYFSRFGQVALTDGRSLSSEQLSDVDVLLVRSVTEVNAELLADSQLKFVGSATSGIDHIDLDYLRQQQIPFYYAPGSNARSVAEYVISSLLLLAKRRGFELADKTLGIVGCGHVGSMVKQFAEIFGMRCLLNDPPRALHDQGEDWCSIEDITKADIISFHVPLAVEGKYPTLQMIDGDFLNRLKSDVILVNTARGSIVDETALIRFKQDKPDSQLIFDVWPNEPTLNMLLLDLADIATPHIAGYSYDGKLRATEMLAMALAKTFRDSTDIKNYNQQEQTETLAINQISDAIHHAYDPGFDAKNLKRMGELQADLRPVYFDELRKQYRIRREFTYYELNAEQLHEYQKQLLQNLGFALVS